MTIGQAQQTATYGEEDGVLEAKGRHDPCVVPLAVPIVEAGADDHRLTLSTADAADGEELIAAAQENRPRKANGGGEGGEEL